MHLSGIYNIIMLYAQVVCCVLPLRAESVTKHIQLVLVATQRNSETIEHEI